MVSFQCEGCGDVLTKKKLDSHRNYCHAPFACIDCMTTFRGSDYRSHTSCITEDQKYQGALYREKPSKAAKRKTVSILEPTEESALVPRRAYVEDAPDVETPPHVPSPPPAVSDKPADSVFDYLVPDDSPAPAQLMDTDDPAEMAMKNGAPSLFSNSRASSRNGHRNQEERVNTKEYEENGFSYGTDPVDPRHHTVNGSLVSLEFMTPAAKITRAKLDRKDLPLSATHSRTNSGNASDKKRKRDEQIHELEGDTLVVAGADHITRSVIDTPGVVHSGLTGGLNRMLSKEDNYSPLPRSPEAVPKSQRDTNRRSRQSTRHEDPASPLKRTRHSKEDPNGLGISIKGRAGRALSMVAGAFAAGGAPSEERSRRHTRSSSHEHNQARGVEAEKREWKKHKVQRHNGTASGNIRHEPRSRHRGSTESPEPRRRVKAIEDRKPDDSVSDSEEDRRRGTNGQMVVFGAEEKIRVRCEAFLSYVTKGPDSEKGCSINKALKRWHREGDVRHTSDKLDEERDLWKGLRMKKNEGGEIVVFF